MNSDLLTKSLPHRNHDLVLSILAEEGKVNFDQFCVIVMPFLEEDDDEAMHEELKEAFRLYDKGGRLRAIAGMGRGGRQSG